MTDFAQGYRVYAGIIMLLLGALGIGKYINEGELNNWVNALLVVAGGVVSFYFNYKNHQLASPSDSDNTPVEPTAGM